MCCRMPQEATGGPGKPWDPGGPGRLRHAPGCPKRPREAPGGREAVGGSAGRLPGCLRGYLRREAAQNRRKTAQNSKRFAQCRRPSNPRSEAQTDAHRMLERGWLGGGWEEAGRRLGGGWEEAGRAQGEGCRGALRPQDARARLAGRRLG